MSAFSRTVFTLLSGIFLAFGISALAGTRVFTAAACTTIDGSAIKGRQAAVGDAIRSNSASCIVQCYTILDNCAHIIPA